MDAVNIIKWLDDLQGQIDRLTRKVGNGGGTPPTPTPANPLVLLHNGTTKDATMELCPDLVTAWTSNGPKLKAGGGTFKSYVISTGIEIDPSDYDKVSISMSYQGNTVTQDINLSELTFEPNTKYNFGAFYEATSQWCQVGVCYSPCIRPQDLTVYHIARNSGMSGDIVAYELALTKTTNSTKRRTKK